MTIVTTIDAAWRTTRDHLANSFTSVSLNPPLVLVCIARHSNSCAAFRGCTGFTINILCKQQKHLSIRFAQRTNPEFLGIEWHRGLTGAPILPASLRLACMNASPGSSWISATTSSGSAGRRIRKSSLPPLAYFQGLYVCFSLLEDGIGKLAGEVSGRCPDRRWRPLGDHTRTTAAGACLRETLRTSRTIPVIDELFSKLDAAVEISFLYSMFTAKCDGLTVPRPSWQSHKAVRGIREYGKLPP